MGVFGLWRLIDATGKPVPLETLEGKVLAVDVSIWIHQVLQGYQDHHGNPKPNAHLIGLFNRICKLLYFKIKPVFVFDGGVPMLKKSTIAARRKQKSIAMSKAQKMKTDLINNLVKHSAVKSVLNEDDVPCQKAEVLQKKSSVYDMFALPDMSGASRAESYISDDEYDSDSTVSLSPRKQLKWIGNIYNVDVTSAEFKALPADIRYDILTDLKETRKQNSWGRLHEMPDRLQDFTNFQVKRLLKRRMVQESLETAEKEMGGRTLTLEELNNLLTAEGIDTSHQDDAFRIAADSTTRLIYISDKNALAASSANANTDSNKAPPSSDKKTEPVAGPSGTSGAILGNINEYQIDDDSDSDIEVINNNSSCSLIDDINEYDFDSDWESDSEVNQSYNISKKYFGKNNMNSVLSYMLEYSGLTQNEIVGLIKNNKKEDIANALNKGNAPKTQKSICDAGSIDSCKNDAASEKFSLLLSEIKKDVSTPDSPVVSEHVDGDDNVLRERVENSSLSKLIETHGPRNDSSESEGFVEVTDITDTNVIFKPSTCQTNSTNEKFTNEATDQTCALSVGKDNDTVSTSETDTDDFIEIEDVLIPEISNTKTDVIKGAVQITIKADEKPEDDMFADIFETEINRNEQENCVALEILESKIEDKKQHDDSSPTKQSNHGSEILKTIPEQPENHANTSTEPENISSVKVLLDISEENKDDSERISIETRIETIAADTSDVEKPPDDSVRNKPPVLPVNEGELLSLKAHLEDEQKELAGSIGKLERQATDITDQIRIEAQELLRLFGIPYIVAPMEAEAQCAYLEQVKLTDGTITDDSDIWLFGGQCVYKNFFNNSKRVLRFLSCDIQHHFKLTRQQMIQLALLVGSDYTTGISGIGPVTALEVLAAFPSDGNNLLRGLSSFSTWLRTGRSAGPGKASLRNKLRNVTVEKGFPSQAVVQAYLFPTVDESKEGFTWGKPNMTLLSDYARSKFGWSKQKFDEIMGPVIKRIEEHKSQKGIDSYFKLQATPKSIEANLSKRVQKAVQRLDNKYAENTSDAEQPPKRSKKKSAGRTSKKQKEVNTDQSGFIEELKPVVDVSAKDVEPESVQPNIPVVSEKKDEYTKEYIPQREKDKANSLKKKLHAIEVFRKSKQGLSKSKRVKRSVRKVTKEAELSESSSSS